MGAWLVVAFVVVSSWVSYRVWEARHRARWQALPSPPVDVGVGAYRTAPVSGSSMPSAPWPLRALAMTCVLYGRAITFALLCTAAHLAGVALPGIALPTIHALLGYFAAGFGVGAVGLLVMGAMVLGVGNDLLVRDHRRAYARARATAIAALALHGAVLVNAGWAHALVGVGGRDIATSLRVTTWVAAGSLAHACVLLALALAYRAQLTAGDGRRLLVER